MDKGAHFYRCDFQVHSPRDKAWAGKKFGVAADDIEALTPEHKQQIIAERIQFAKEYLEKARTAGLNAIAVTDHHDVHSLKTIRKIAQEQNEDFTASSQFDKLITVFPGIELTLSNPVCQCILLFDADFADAHLDSVIAFLGVNSTHEFETSTVETQRISQQIINDLVHLHNKLDELTYCRGRYIVLPNVGDGGQHSILRQGSMSIIGKCRVSVDMSIRKSRLLRVIKIKFLVGTFTTVTNQ